ncbi:MAG: C39 family peptidase [Synechococcales bacterium]|nr:C39 family peptidase [Synechococcales bacterium]
MPTLKSTHRTVIKAKPVSSNALTPAEVLSVDVGYELKVTILAGDRDQHDVVDLEAPILASDGTTYLSRVYVYRPHWMASGLGQLLNTSGGGLKLPVQWRTQIGNEEDDPDLGHWFGNGNRQCNLTSHAMLLGSIFGDAEIEERARKSGFNEPEGWYGEILNRYGDTTDHTAQTAALEVIGIKSYWSTTLSVADALKQMEKGIGVVVGYAYKSSGHICMMAGYDREKREVLTHDPYGCRAGAEDYYITIGEGGAYDPYSADVIAQIWLDPQSNESGWGRIITEIAGEPTGMDEGL